MDERKIGRREFLHASALAVLGTAAAACAPTPEVIEKVVKETVVVEKEVTKVVEKEVEKEVTKVVEKEVEKKVTVVVEVEPEKFMESPAVAGKVSSGELPPVAERLPVDPLVVGGREAIGQYGGELLTIHPGPGSVRNYSLFMEAMLNYSDLDLRTILPGILESWETTDDGKSFTFRLRKGMKWSDGEPLTAEDLRFWWEDDALNAEISGSVNWKYRFGGETMKVEVLDDQTYKFVFASPFGNYPAYLTRAFSNSLLLPAHYQKQFHADYADKAKLDTQAKEEGYDNWVQLYSAKRAGASVWGIVPNSFEYPIVRPYQISLTTEADSQLFEPNPYYWKVDQVGNQLPYLASNRCDLVQQEEMVTMKAMRGELDYVGPLDVTIANYPLYKENEQEANMVVADLLSCMTDRYVLFPSHTLPEDPVLQEIIRHPNFVKALSVAIDRDEINQSLFFGLARMGQLSPMPMSQYYKEKYGTAWAQNDPDLANQLLDEMGLDKRNSEGFRLRPDGETLNFNIEHTGSRIGASTHAFTEMVVTFWREVGIDATTKEIAIALYDQRWNQGLIHCGVWVADRCIDTLMPLEMRWFIPTDIGQGGCGPLWGQWFQSGGDQGEEPPEEIKQTFEWYDIMNATADEDERIATGQKIFDYLAENPLAIGIVLESPAPILFSNKLRNLPRPKMPFGWDTLDLHLHHPEAFFYES